MEPFQHVCSWLREAASWARARTYSAARPDMAEVADVDESAGRALRLAPPQRQGLMRLLFSGGLSATASCTRLASWMTSVAGAERTTRRCRTS
eukprot:4683048-Alexandrium_andersonii.AAC.1